MSKPIFGYWSDARGFGQPIRFLLAYLEVDYQNQEYTNYTKRDSWFSVKFKLGLDFPNVPYLIDGDVKMTEAKPIIRYLARKYDPTLIPSGDLLWKAEMMESFVTDIWDLLILMGYQYTDEIRRHFLVSYASKLTQLSKFIDGKIFSLGHKVHYVDFLLYECLYHYKTFDEAIISPFPNLKTFMKNFEGIPSIAAYMDTPNFLKGPCFTSEAIHQF